MSLIEAVATDKPVTFVRLQPEIKAALQDAAAKDRRSLSTFMEAILAEWLQAHGYPKIELRGPKTRRS